ncbi:hypothetical protein [Parvularcula sp. LCG005]|uniref:hypothetical protein n=1 Tax=Parvularcula sp. LCG005 TaxID=3078805 RepID=UPI002941FD9D|nr:hypothetical protein [Parvularcula sp. LCG005]WOI53394.1 hypothetical protein RUI03_00020 [Parvularcula sp. LCG005]
MTDDDDFPEIDDDTYAQLEREAPVLSRLKRFADGLDRASWFSHLGEAPTLKVRAAAIAYVEALGFPDAQLAILPTWEDAAGSAETNDWASAPWEAEELARADLTGRALEIVSQEALEIGLAMVAQQVGKSAKDAMEEQASLWDVVDESDQRLAVGAAAQAAHGMGLLLIAAAADPDIDVTEHPFATKMRLFELGRWPVSVIGGTFNVF